MLDMDRICSDVLPKLGPESARLLWSPLPWRLAESFGSGTVEAPILTAEGVRWLRRGLAPVVDRVERALAEFDLALASATEAVVDFPMGTGSLLVMNNKRTVHARTAVEDPSRSSRLVLRTKVYRRTGGRYRPDTDRSDGY